VLVALPSETVFWGLAPPPPSARLHTHTPKIYTQTVCTHRRCWTVGHSFASPRHTTHGFGYSLSSHHSTWAANSDCSGIAGLSSSRPSLTSWASTRSNSVFRSSGGRPDSRQRRRSPAPAVARRARARFRSVFAASVRHSSRCPPVLPCVCGTRGEHDRRVTVPTAPTALAVGMLKPAGLVERSV